MKRFRKLRVSGSPLHRSGQSYSNRAHSAPVLMQKLSLLLQLQERNSSCNNSLGSIVMRAIRIATVVLAMGYASQVPAADTPKEQTKSTAKKQATKTAPKKTTETEKSSTGDQGAAKQQDSERGRKTESAPATTNPAPNMRPVDPLNPDPMRPGTPPTFPRNPSSPQTPVKPTDPTAPTTVK